MRVGLFCLRSCSLLSRIKGACQVSMPMSYDPIEIIPMTITRCCVASDAERKGEDKGAKKGVSIDESDDGVEKKTKDRMIGRRSIIRYGLYHMSIQINSAMAQRNGVTMDDVNLLIDALQHMFEEDMSSSRALTLRKLIVVEHTKPMGNAYRDTIERALAARLKQPNDAPTSYEDYEVTYHREMLPDEVKVTEYNYNSQSV
jgi:CRISPR/Cas system type I-B associated protein Csh2 (Cas7 group RAMP superfamily)